MRIKEILEKNTNNLHHFYTIIGNNDRNRNEVKEFLKENLNFDTNQNLDFFDFKEDLIKIETARKIKQKNSVTKSSQKGLKVFFIAGKNINKEAQNALLKTTEEPNSNTVFFIFLPQKDFLLDTVLSRTILINGHTNFENKKAEDFLFLDFKDKEKNIREMEKEEYLDFLESLDFYILEHKNQFLEKGGEKEFLEKYQKFLELKKQAYFKGSNVSNILIFTSLLFGKI
ncbi:hypothetical protein CSB11_02185 [Candidatus Campbellbacteria bacterium]|nr:MAG: hypothetical protein CSB11_02185 [Candidatus Campbellbacteria bacterium]